MSYRCQTILCYGVKYNHNNWEKYVAAVGEKEAEEIFEDYFIIFSGYHDCDGILGIEIKKVDPGEGIDLGSLAQIGILRDSKWEPFRKAMAKIQEFSQPQFWLICQED